MNGKSYPPTLFLKKFRAEEAVAAYGYFGERKKAAVIAAAFSLCFM